MTIPRGALLTARLYQLSNEPDASFAYQEGDLLDDRGNVVVNLYKSVNNRAAWVLGRWNLAAYAGRTLWLYFGVHGDGYAKRSTQQFVDDVILTGATGPTPSPSPKYAAKAAGGLCANLTDLWIRIPRRSADRAHVLFWIGLGVGVAALGATLAYVALRIAAAQPPRGSDDAAHSAADRRSELVAQGA